MNHNIFDIRILLILYLSQLSGLTNNTLGKQLKEFVYSNRLIQHIINLVFLFVLISLFDQGISLNLFFPFDVEPKWFSKCHITAWEEGIKSLYYVRTESILSRNMNQNTFSDCIMCEG